MGKSKKGKRHLLLVPKRTMERLWKPCFTLGVLLAVLLWQAKRGPLIFIPQKAHGVLVAAMVFVLLFAVFAAAARNMNYVQPRANHLRIITPFLRLKISYNRIRTSYPVEFSKTYPPDQMRWAQKRFLKPFFLKTALAVKLTQYPLPHKFLRLFLARQVFLPGQSGFLFLVEDWMSLSTEISSFAQTWRAKQAH